MAEIGLRRRMASLATVLGIGVVLPFTVGAAAAYAQPVLEITKTQNGEFTRGGTGRYTITITNTGDQVTQGSVVISDDLPTGLTVQSLSEDAPPSAGTCSGINPGDAGFQCILEEFPVGATYTFDLTVNVAADAPCSVRNTVRVSWPATGPGTRPEDAASVLTNITGGGCGGDGDGDGGGGGSSILPINLSGVLPMFNNITTNSNINSPGASNRSGQVFGVNAP